MVKATLYDRDFLQWTEQQIACLQKGQWENVDVDNLVEELGDLGRSEQKELGSYLKVLIMHLLKWQYQPERRTASWEITLANCRDGIQDCLEDSPSLQRFLKDTAWVAKYYRRARRDAAKETQMPMDTFPTACPYSLEEMLDLTFLPNTPD
ncbi:DUF29 domain-containing protein [Nodosilinea sp. P-1105]|uniref:DUF29 domain-containing protein n=1 Tax=Nodosilinea sp. P-1105 TaxID=2546229 RepID=UPI00146D023A|nr:DUF29 domain-containing protein [Nodosilinea sp. P-1105]NMF85658.1 DUF29 domain-containing protein [Nodosilinea sp. P-1105]